MVVKFRKGSGDGPHFIYVKVKQTKTLLYTFTFLHKVSIIKIISNSTFYKRIHWDEFRSSLQHFQWANALQKSAKVATVWATFDNILLLVIICLHSYVIIVHVKLSCCNCHFYAKYRDKCTVVTKHKETPTAEIIKCQPTLSNGGSHITLYSLQ